ncbi:hypothetical protein [Salinimicrobium gaetbulicola]|uniref:RES domain-containing protein n=1 Tax=Salinimicrobium gaetbulicola TaxID=999702 RepID=A0ABW3IC33_9FLAO
MTNKDINDFTLLLNTLNYISVKDINESSEKWIIEVLNKSLPLFTHLINSYSLDKIERITINRRIHGSNKRIKEIKFLKYPPADKVANYGRCNLPKQSILYASPLYMTAISEMQPRVGDLITKSIWTKKNSKELKLCPIFHIQPTDGSINPHSWRLEKEFNKLVKQNHPKEQQEIVISLSKFIAYHFSKYVDRQKPKNYLFSAFFSNKILNDFEGGTIDGIIYPSVRSKLSFENVALKPDVFDLNYQLSEVHESIITKDPSDGDKGYLMDGLNFSKEFDYETGEIMWDDSIKQPQERIDFFKKHFQLDLE